MFLGRYFGLNTFFNVLFFQVCYRLRVMDFSSATEQAAPLYPAGK